VSLNDQAFGDEPVVIYTHERLRAGGGYGLLISRFEGSIPSRRTNFPAEFPS